MGRTLQQSAQRHTSCQIEEGDDLAINLGSISRAEVVKADKRIKNLEAPGPDNTPPEVMEADIGSM